MQEYYGYNILKKKELLSGIRFIRLSARVTKSSIYFYEYYDIVMVWIYIYIYIYIIHLITPCIGVL